MEKWTEQVNWQIMLCLGIGIVRGHISVLHIPYHQTWTILAFCKQWNTNTLLGLQYCNTIPCPTHLWPLPVLPTKTELIFLLLLVILSNKYVLLLFIWSPPSFNFSSHLISNATKGSAHTLLEPRLLELLISQH